MKTDLAGALRSGWSLLTDVPGCPRASWAARGRRAFPLLLPALALLGFGVWKVARFDPQLRAAHESHRSLFALEREVTALRFSGSDAEARTFRVRAGQQAQALLPPSAADGGSAGNELAGSLERAAVERGWQADFRPEAGVEAPGPGGRIGFLNITGKLQQARDNAHPWPTLLLLLDQFSSQGKHIDLTRLAIRADEEGNYSVEANLRLAYLLTHEKIAQ